MSYDPFANFAGGFSPNDGTIDFYLRINALIKESDVVLDLGAGRAAWFEDDTCETRRSIRQLKGKVARVIAADVDEAVFDNRASDEQFLMKEGKLELEKESIDLIVADYVLEHLTDPAIFVQEIDDVLKSGGWFCARTPHKYSYVARFASLVKNSSHSKVLSKVQPDRKEMDVFPTAYKMNTMKEIRKSFAGWGNHSYVSRPDPAYFMGNKMIFEIQNVMHRIMFKEMCGNLLVFVQKK